MRSALAFVLLLTACDNAASLRVDLRTDLRPGYEFALVRVVVEDPTGAVHTESSFLDRSTDTIEGVTVANLDVAEGENRLTATIFNFDGSELLARRQLVLVAGATSTVVTMTSNCVGVTCGGATPECVNGVCVIETCSSQDPDACGGATCTGDADCPAPAPCTRGVCRESFCLSEPDDSACATSEFCSAETGCEREPGDAGPPPDAGPPGIDAGPGPDAGPPNVDAGGACEVPTTAIVAFPAALPTPPGWTCVSCADGDALFRRFPRGNETAGAQGGDDTHTHTFTTSETLPTEQAVRVGDGATGAASALAHLHGGISGTTLPASHVPPFTSVKYLQAITPQTTLPAGAILMFAGPLPAGFARVAELDDRYVRGGDAPLVDGGPTHLDVAVGTFTASELSERADVSLSACLAAAVDHTHELDEDIESDNAPPYIQVIFGRATSEAPVPAGALHLFLDAPPAGWTRLSDVGDPAFEVFFVGSDTVDLGPGLGEDGHAPMGRLPTGLASDSEGFVGAPMCNSMSDVSRAGAEHRHLVDVAMSEESPLPPYTDVIVARRDGC